DGSDRLIVADLVTGQTLELYDAFDADTKQPTSPAISADGKTVTNGSRGHGLFWTPLTAFPDSSGSRFGAAYFQGSPLLDPTATDGSPGVAVAFRVSTRTAAGRTLGRVMVTGIGDSTPPLALLGTNVQTTHPAIGRPPGRGMTIVYDQHALDANGN